MVRLLSFLSLFSSTYFGYFLSGTKNSEIEYFLMGELHQNFTIEAKTGLVRPRNPIDFEYIEGPEEENVRILYLTVRARDMGSPSLYRCSIFWRFQNLINI